MFKREMFLLTGLIIGYCSWNAYGDFVGDGDDIRAYVKYLPDDVKTKFENSVKLFNETIWNKTAMMNEYAQFQCAISDGRRSIERLNYDVQEFKEECKNSNNGYLKKKIPRKYFRTFEKVVRRLSRFRCGTDAHYFALENAKDIWRYVSFGTTSLAKRIRSNVLVPLDLQLVCFSATIQGSYYLFNRYIHTDRGTHLETPAIRKYLYPGKNGKRSLLELLKEENHWEYRLVDLHYLNLLRRLMRPQDFTINYLEISSSDNYTKLVMPVSKPELGCPNPIYA